MGSIPPDTVSVLLVNLGTPERPDANAVRAFLAEFLSDPDVIDLPRWLWQPILRGMVLRSRPRKVAELYRTIWPRERCADTCPPTRCSPLTCGTRRITAALQATLGDDFRVDWAYRYGPRNIESGLSRSAGGSIVVVPLFPQRTSSTTGSVSTEVARAAARRGMQERVRELHIPPDDPGYVAALAARCGERLATEPSTPDHLLISFHGIPTRYDRREGGVYVSDCRRTTDALLAALEWEPDRATLCFQSKFGPEPWLLPATSARIEELAASGTRDLAVVAPGFLTEGLETLEELEQRGREAFVEAGGGHYSYLPAVEDHPAFIEGLAALIREHAEERRTGAGRSEIHAGRDPSRPLAGGEQGRAHRVGPGAGASR